MSGVAPTSSCHGRMMPMDFSFKRCAKLGDDDSLLLDRLTTLPIELLIRILSLLPTKDAAATCILSKKMRCAFHLITSLDFDDSPVSHCLEHPYAIERFPTFIIFVNTVLQAYQSQYLTTFRLRVGTDFVTRYFNGCSFIQFRTACRNCCFPDLKYTQINAWITFPLTLCGLRELDLRIHVREPGDGQVPPEIFMCETLKMLKLDVNLGLDQASTMPSFRLPNLKLLHLGASLISEDSFVTRLVSSCPLLEDLTVQAWWNHVHTTSISSTSLRRLCLKMFKLDLNDHTDSVLIYTPNLEDLEYVDNFALQYSVTNMDCLVKANISILSLFRNEPFEVSTRQMLSIIRPLSKVQHLSLKGRCIEVLKNVDQLPMLPNLKYLELNYTPYTFWHKVLLEFLRRSPVLETLVFPQGMASDEDYDIEVIVDEYDRKQLELERELSRTAQAIIPWCCRFHLKRIVIKYFWGNQREIYLIQFLLKHALVLEELVVFQSQHDYNPIAYQMSIQSTLQNLPRASDNCSIRMQD